MCLADRYKTIYICASGSVGGARPCQGRGRGFESRLALFLYTKGILKGYLLYINESCRTRTFEVSALLRSVQNRHPPDVVHRLALNQKEVRTDIYMQESCRTRTVRIFVPLRPVLTEVQWTSSTPSRAMKDSAGLERFVSSFHFGRCRIVFF